MDKENVYMCVCVCVCVCMGVCVYGCVCVCIYMCVCVCIYIYIWVCMCVYIYNEILVWHKKDQNIVICDDMERPPGHYTKHNKSDRERQILYNLSYVQS